MYLKKVLLAITEHYRKYIKPENLELHNADRIKIIFRQFLSFFLS